jgi:hypothetical protein
MYIPAYYICPKLRKSPLPYTELTRTFLILLFL